MEKKKILYLGNKLMKHGHAATSLETLGPLLEEEGYRLYYSSDKMNMMLRLMDMVFAICRLRKGVDYVMVDTYSRKSFYGTIVVVSFCKLLNLKYILFLHGGDLPNRLKRFPNLSSFTFKEAFRLVAPSGYLQAAFNLHGFTTELIPNNIDIKQYSFKLRNKIKPRILYVRAFHKIYNPQMAIYVIKELKKDFPDAVLCMIGPDKDGTMEVCRKLAIELGVDKDVEFTGKLSKEDWHKKSEDYDVFINTTDVDNTPVSVCEAMALGMPVVSTSVGGIPYLLNNNKNALLVDKGDVEGMVNAIKQLISKPDEALSLAQKGRSLVESFDWNIVKEKWNNLFLSN